jgi:hypothetical protein
LRMNKSLLFRFWDSIGTVTKLIENWKPDGCGLEKDYEDSLYAYLHEQLSEIQITRQYARGRSRVDLRVGETVVVELKCDLDSTSEYQRLLGQLLEMKRWEERIVVVFAGNTDPYFLKALKKETEEWGSYPMEQKVVVVQKISNIAS